MFNKDEKFFKFVNELECKLLQLENLGENIDSHVLCALILKKLPESVVQKIISSESRTSGKNKFCMMRELINSRVKNKLLIY